MYIKNPMEIESRSMELIEKALGTVNFSEKEKIIAKRMIHTTGDLEYRSIIFFKNGFVAAAQTALQNGITVFTDTKMTYSGINKPALLKTKNELLCLIDDEQVIQTAKKTVQPDILRQ